MGYRGEMYEEIGDMRWTAFQILFRVIVPIVVISGVLAYGCHAISVGTGVVDRVINPDSIVQNYEWFEQQHDDIQAATAQLADAESNLAKFKTEAGPRDKWTFDDRQEANRLNAVAEGIRQERLSRIKDYNARSRMISRNLWKPQRSLPHQIPLE